MNILIIDTETSGLPISQGFNKYFNYSLLDKYDNSRLLSVCWIIYENNIKKKKYYNIIKPSNFIIDNSSKSCEINGITQELAISKGIDINKVLDELNNDLSNINLIVAHNINFDKNILLSEMYRNNQHNLINNFLSKNFYCTMENGTTITNIKFNNSNKLKYPKLIELYKYFFKKEFDNAHNAEADVEACAKCYFEMIK